MASASLVGLERVPWNDLDVQQCPTRYQIPGVDDPRAYHQPLWPTLGPPRQASSILPFCCVVDDHLII